MVPRNWQDQYKLTGGTVLHSVCKLLEALECIKKAYLTEKECEGPTASATGGGSFKKRMVSFSDGTPKKSRKEAKHCALCNKHGDTQNTHNTGNCKKYDSDGTPKKGFAEKSAQCNSHNGSTSHDQKTNYAQLSANIA